MRNILIKYLGGYTKDEKQKAYLIGRSQGTLDGIDELTHLVRKAQHGGRIHQAAYEANKRLRGKQMSYFVELDG